ncbi:MAG: hypothetical protein FWH27_07115 [Planctomycetaceae bacterium]|nr:hypothetical protein [Planctomycetaceae bacterium]
MKKIDSYWVSIAVMIIGVWLMWTSRVNYQVSSDNWFTMLVIAAIAGIVTGAGLVATGLITLTINDIFKRP